MLSKPFIFCAAVTLAILVVVFLTLFSPIPHKDSPLNKPSKPWLALSLYIQQPQPVNSNMQVAAPPDSGALIFRRELTEGPETTSRVVGKAQGFIIPVEHFAHSGFNIIYLTFNTHEYSGSVSIQAKNLAHGVKDELTVVGGTGSFAFVRGLAVFARGEDQGVSSNQPYHIKLQLKFPNISHTVPG